MDRAANRPTHSEFRLTWDMARAVSDRHAPHLVATGSGIDVLCEQCLAVWPCDPRQNSDDTMRLMETAQADWRPPQPAQTVKWHLPRVARTGV